MRPVGRAAIAVLAIACVAHGPFAAAEVRLPRLLADGAILQRDTANTIRGWAADGETVSARLDGRDVGTTVAAGGAWTLELGPMPAGGPHRLVVAGRNRLVVDDLWFGDVWIASGQSNMQLTMARAKPLYADQIRAADYPRLRMFTVPLAYDFDAPREDLAGGRWRAATPESVPDFSAVAFFFARELHERYEVPIGIVNASYGGSPAEGWMSEEALERFPHYLEIARRYRDDAYLDELKRADREQSRRWHQRLDANDAGLDAATPWYQPGYDASSWQRIELPGDWADATSGAVNGVAWFRKRVTLPASAAGEPAQLLLGRIVDADTTWVNGVEVGSTGYQYPPRRYTVPRGLLEGGANTIVVRVVSRSGRGGFVEDKPYRLDVGDTRVALAGTWRFCVGAESEPLPAPRFLEYKQPLGYYNAMLAPLTHRPIRGVIWYQGESNTDRPGEYAELFPALIRDWRRQWGQGDFPFLYVQLANFMAAADEPTESRWAETREAQRAALAEPNTAMAVTIDAGVWNDIHPLDKKTVGHRLALAARHLAYGERHLAWSGPMLESVDVDDGRVVLRFRHTDGGLQARGGDLGGFALTAGDGTWVRAEAAIDGDRVIVTSDEVPQPVRVRYAWADNPAAANLYNGAGLPASPFEAGPH